MVHINIVTEEVKKECDGEMCLRKCTAHSAGQWVLIKTVALGNLLSIAHECQRIVARNYDAGGRRLTTGPAYASNSVFCLENYLMFL